MPKERWKDKNTESSTRINKHTHIQNIYTQTLITDSQILLNSHIKGRQIGTNMKSTNF